MYICRTLTATVYMVNNNKVLLHIHKKYKSLFHIFVYMEIRKLSEQAALREVYEECCLQIKLYDHKRN